MLEVPCRYCTERTSSCHCTCDKYKEYKVEMERIREERTLLRRVSGYSPGLIAEVIKKFKKRRK
jgi:hypothetical protein